MSRVVLLALNAADHLMAKGRLDAAASILQNYLSTSRPEPEVLQRLGRIYLAQGRSAEAVPLLQQALTCFSGPVTATESIKPENSSSPALDFDPSSTQTNIEPRFISSH